MTDEDILARLRLSAEHAKGLLQAANGYSASVPTPTPSSAVAAAALGPNCSAADVERFVSSRIVRTPGVAAIYYGPQAPADDGAE